MTQADDDLEAEGVELNDSSTISIESSGSDSSPGDGSNASSSDDGAPTPTTDRSCTRQFVSPLSAPGDGEGIREERTRAQTRAAAVISMIGPCGGGRLFHTLLTAQYAGDVPTKLFGIVLSRRRNRNRRPRRVAKAFGRLHGGNSRGVGWTSTGPFAKLLEVSRGQQCHGSKAAREVE